MINFNVLDHLTEYRDKLCFAKKKSQIVGMKTNSNNSKTKNHNNIKINNNCHSRNKNKQIHFVNQ